jgi:hypothetical protein
LFRCIYMYVYWEDIILVLFYWLSNIFSRFTAMNISSIFFILHDHALSMIAVNDCVCMDFSLLFSLFPHVNTIHTYI